MIDLVLSNLFLLLTPAPALGSSADPPPTPPEMPRDRVAPEPFPRLACTPWRQARPRRCQSLYQTGGLTFQLPLTDAHPVPVLDRSLQPDRKLLTQTQLQTGIPYLC